MTSAISLLALLLAAPLARLTEEADWTTLFNGKDLSGWHLTKPDGPNLWCVENGILSTARKGTDLQSDREFYNFELHVEYRLTPGNNSGLYLRDRYEIQIADSAGKPVEEFGCGALYRRVPPSVNACRRAGEWETFDVVFVGQRLTVFHNGTRIHSNIETGPKGTGKSSGRDDGPGPLRLQGDHGAVAFRNIKIRPVSEEECARLLTK